MKSLRNLLNLFRAALSDGKVRATYDKLEIAIRRKAAIASEAEFHRTMANFYTERVLEFDPNVDWWGFANAKQKQYDHQEKHGKEELKLEEATALVKVCQESYRIAQKALDEIPSAN